MDPYTTISYYIDDPNYVINDTYILEEPDRAMSPDYIITITMGVLIALFNGVLICGILLNRDLRGQPKYLLVLILCCVDFVSGAFSHPAFVVSSEITSRHKLGDYCPTFFLYIVPITALYESTAAILMVCILVINWIVTVTVKAYNEDDRKKLAIAMTIFAHVGAFIIAMACVTPNVAFLSDYCLLHYFVHIPVVLVSESPQLLFLMVVVIFLIISYNQQKKLVVLLSFPIDLVVASIVTILCLLPYNIYSFFNFVLTSYYFSLVYLGHFLLLRLGALRCMILPFVWLLDRHFRAELKRGLMCKAQCRNSTAAAIELQDKP